MDRRLESQPVREDSHALPVVVPFAEDVFTWPAEKPQLIGGQSADCAAVFFLEQPSCGSCGSTAMER